MISDKTQSLLEKLAADPKRFDEEGGAYALLQCLFREKDVSFLSALLRSDDRHMLNVASYCASELGIRAYPVIDDVLPLAKSADVKVAYCAIEVIAVCSVLDHLSDYWALLDALEHVEQVIRVRAMDLLVMAEPSQLEAAAKAGKLGDEHAAGLRLVLIDDGRAIDTKNILQAIFEGNALTCRYGAVAAARLSLPFISEVDGRMDSDKMGDVRAFMKLKSIQRRFTK